MHVKHPCVAVLLACTVAGRARGQIDTISPRPLFTVNDAYLAAIFVAGTVALHPFDKAFAQRMQDSSTQTNRFFGEVATTVRLIAEPGSWLIGSSMYVGGRLAHNGRMADLGLHGTEALVVGGLSGSVIKAVVGRARPYVDKPLNPNDYSFGRGLKGADYQSFPSGHTTAAFAAAAAVTSETSRWWPSSRWLIGSAMYGGATMVGLSRMYNNKHWASDVVLGAAIGTFAGNKVVRYHRSHPGNRIDKWLLGVSVVSDDHHGYTMAWSVVPDLVRSR